MITVGEPGDGKLRLILDKDGGGGSYDAVRVSVITINDNQWHFVAGVYNDNSGILNVYIYGLINN